LAFIQNPLIAVAISFIFLGILLYKRVNLGITLNATALLLALLAVDLEKIPTVISETTFDVLTVSIVLATFGIMLLSQLYKETKLINQLSESMSRIINNPKIVLSLLPAVMGFLPVAGGALMSAPLVDSEAEKIGLKRQKKAYVNFWFRHTIFPIYPLSQVLIVAAALAGISIASIMLRQIPVVIVMIIVGYAIGFWKTPKTKNPEASEKKNSANSSDFRSFSTAFAPILATIIVAVSLSLAGFNLSQQGLDVLVATFVGVFVLVAISKPSFNVFSKPFKNWGIYGITLAAYGAFLLGSMIKATGIPGIFETFAANGSIDSTLLLTVIPAASGILTASALGGVSISIPILGGIIALSPKTASLIYMSAYLGYVMSPTHLCLAFTADYFGCSLEKIYKYAVPSFIATITTTLLIYFLI
jgi:integral membrane protein (TIGR00529 family)